MKVRPVLINLAMLIMLAMLGVAINPKLNAYDVTLLNVFVFCLIFGIPLFFLENRHRISYLMQRKKRKELLRIQGYYKTIDYTVCYYHKILDCPFVFMLHNGKSPLIPETGPLSDSDLPCGCVKSKMGHCDITEESK